MTSATTSERLSSAALAEAHEGSRSLVARTPVLSAGSISAHCGGTVVVKAENLQRTGSFKLRGALNKLRHLEPGVHGVVAGSAGNHAQSLAYAARSGGLRCEVFMPVAAAVSKVSAVRAFGASVEQQADSVDECVALARERAHEAGLAFVHPFDDELIIAGQAGVGIELAEDVAELSTVIVPVGGGGLASGVALAVKARHPGVRVIGVQAAACAPFPESLRAGRPLETGPAVTIADGIAIKRPGEITLPLLSELLDDFVTVEEAAIAEAMVLLLERAKLVVEGAGAAGVAALLSGAVKPDANGVTAVILSGGNVDAALLAGLATRHETEAGRRIRLLTRVPDRPGGLAGLLTLIAQDGVNVLSVEHVRDGMPLGVRQTGVELILETRGREHGAELLGDLRRHGYDLVEVPYPEVTGTPAL
ncbi:MAG TPA: threonine ammonia-lyase [Solirubrobacteraceae bacterium]|nr:threonine ammonia-lyase [Solirubrobacteraceae bacterium]